MSVNDFANLVQEEFKKLPHLEHRQVADDFAFRFAKNFEPCAPMFDLSQKENSEQAKLLARNLHLFLTSSLNFGVMEARRLKGTLHKLAKLVAQINASDGRHSLTSGRATAELQESIPIDIAFIEEACKPSQPRTNVTARTHARDMAAQHLVDQFRELSSNFKTKGSAIAYRGLKLNIPKGKQRLFEGVRAGATTIPFAPVRAASLFLACAGSDVSTDSLGEYIKAHKLANAVAKKPKTTVAALKNRHQV